MSSKPVYEGILGFAPFGPAVLLNEGIGPKRIKQIVFGPADETFLNMRGIKPQRGDKVNITVTDDMPYCVDSIIAHNGRLLVDLSAKPETPPPAEDGPSIILIP
jgi:hypothetical protein